MAVGSVRPSSPGLNPASRRERKKGKGKGRERQKQKQDGNDCRQNLRRAEPDVLYQLPN